VTGTTQVPMPTSANSGAAASGRCAGLGLITALVSSRSAANKANNRQARYRPGRIGELSAMPTRPGRNCAGSHVPKVSVDAPLKPHERLCRVPGGWPAAVRSLFRGPAALRTGTPGSAAVVEGHLVAVGVREREGAAERPVGGR
jgi:hypothetical protein